jgi:hypothetical protein
VEAQRIRPQPAEPLRPFDQQHAIQQREGFAKGGSPGGMAMEGQRALNELEGYNKALSAIARQMDKAKSRGDAQTLETLRTQYDEIMNSKLSLNSMILDDPYQAYHHLAGEAEARATQARMHMDMPQRLATFPADSYDVPLDQLIVRYGDGPSMLITDIKPPSWNPRTSIPVGINPTKSELRELLRDEQAISAYRTLRTLLDEPTNTLYAWPADAALHQDIGAYYGLMPNNTKHGLLTLD